jgi:hypothetical protein
MSRHHALHRRYGRAHSYEGDLAEILAANGYSPKEAKRLAAEGMGPFELEHRIKSTQPGAMGSLEYTHNIFKIAKRARRTR